MANWKKKLKKAAKVAVPVLGALALAKGLGRKKGIGIGAKRPGDDTIPGMLGDRGFPKKWTMPHDKVFGDGIGIAKGGRIGKKGGGRTGKQFGGGLGSTARRDMRSGYYPSDMGMRGGTMYKKGGRVKSMGKATRGGGVAKR